MQAKKSHEETSDDSLEQEMQQMQQQLYLIKQEHNEIAAVRESLETISELKGGSDVLVSIGKGVFVNAKISDNSSVVVSVGSDVIVKKKIKDAIKNIGDEAEQMRKYADEFEAELKRIIKASN